MKRIIFSIALLLLIFAGCKFEDKEDKLKNRFILKGNIDTEKPLHITIEELTTTDINVLDTIKTDESGNFSIVKEIDDAGFYIFRIERDNFITLVIEPGKQITINGKSKNFPLNHEIEGSKDSKLLAELNKKLRYRISKVDSLADLYRESMYDPNFLEIKEDLNVEYTNIFNAHKNYVKEFIKDNPKSLVSIIALYQFFGDRIILSEEEHFEYFESLSKSLSNKYPANKHVIDLKKRVSSIKREKMQRQLAEEKLAIGNPAPEIILPNPEGNSVALSSLKGSIVLIDFWASWHEPSKISNKILLDLYNKYNKKGFEIYGVSIDRAREQWINAIEEENISWTQVSDLRYINSPVLNLYNVEGIPYAVLIDRNGKILSKDIDHREIEEHLKELL